MGGVIRQAHAANIFVGGKQLNSMYHQDKALWEYPELSTYPHAPIATDDDILMAGSSSLAGMVSNLWSAFQAPGQHHWYPTFRDNYSGTFSTTVDGVTLPGTGTALSLGRVPLYQIVQNAENSVYPANVNPLTAMGNYDVLVLDASDFDTPNSSIPEPYYAYSRVPMPNNWFLNYSQMNAEFEARMRLIRLAHAAGVHRVFLCVPWQRWLEAVNDTRDAEWRNNCFLNVEQSMNWQQDRLNYQIKREGLGSYVSIISFLDVIKRVYDDIQSGDAPAELDHIRLLFANADQTGDPLDVDLPKHGYMLNYYGTYATNCLFARVVYGLDPRTFTNTANGLTVPTAIASYFQDIAVELADGNPRSGRSRGNSGYTMAKISEGSPSDFVAPSKLILHQDTEMTSASPASVFAQNAVAAQMVVAFRFNLDQLTTEDQNLFACLSGSGTERSFMAMRNSGVNTPFSGGNDSGSAYSAATLTSVNLTSAGDGETILVADVKFPLASQDKYGYSSNISVINTAAELLNPWADPARYTFVGHNPTVSTVTANRFAVTLAGVTVLDALVTRELLSDGEKFNYYRYLSKKFQVPVWEDLYPDMVA